MRQVQRVLAISLVALLAVGPAFAAPPLAMLKASITSANGLPLSGLDVRLVSLDTGRRVSGVTDASGVFAAEMTPGLYSLDTVGSGYTLLRGPRVVSLAAGQLLATSIALATTTQGTAQPGLTLNHQPIDCFVAGKFPRIDAVVDPMEEFANGRIYFRSAISPEYSVDLAPSVGGVAGTLPAPTLEASYVTYYLQVAGRSLMERKTPEITARVVEKESDCDGKVAAVVPVGPTAALSAGGLLVTPAGFGAGAAAGGILGMSTTTALVVGGFLVAGGAIIIIATTGDDSTPPPASGIR